MKVHKEFCVSATELSPTQFLILHIVQYLKIPKETERWSTRFLRQMSSSKKVEEDVHRWAL
jgi:hypothetical protein